jgi:hypothetical protein
MVHLIGSLPDQSACWRAEKPWPRGFHPDRKACPFGRGVSFLKVVREQDQIAGREQDLSRKRNWTRSVDPSAAPSPAAGTWST